MKPETQLFFHVLGAIVLFGATAAVATLALAGRGRDEPRPIARATLAILLVLAVPAWIATLAFGIWTESAGDWPDGLTWVDFGFRVTDVGLLVVLVSAALAYRWIRRPTGRWAPSAIGFLNTLYLAALAVAWWVMTTKLPA
jgi:hypothetical protein